LCTEVVHSHKHT